MVNMVQSSLCGNADQWLERMHNLENHKKVEDVDTDVSLRLYSRRTGL